MQLSQLLDTHTFRHESIGLYNRIVNPDENSIHEKNSKQIKESNLKDKAARIKIKEQVIQLFEEN